MGTFPTTGETPYGTKVKTYVDDAAAAALADSKTYTDNEIAAIPPGGGAVDSVNSKTGAVVLNKSDIGLGNVDNTSDSVKVSGAGPIKTALDAKANSSSLHAVALSGAYSDLTGKPDPVDLSAKADKTYADEGFTFTPPPTWDSAVNSPAYTSGLTKTGDMFKATTSGTKGFAGVPIMNNLWGGSRMSARIKINKGATSGRSVAVGYASGNPGATINGSTKTVEIAYVAGTGIVLRQQNVTGGPTIVTDANLTDGEFIDVSLMHMATGTKLNPSLGVGIGYRVYRGSTLLYSGLINNNGGTGLYDIWGGGTETATNFYLASDDAGLEISKVKFAPHPLGEIDLPSEGRFASVAGNTNEWAGFSIPAKPNGRVVMIFHGMGEHERTYFASGSPVRSTIDTLTDAGFTVFVPLLRGANSGTVNSNHFGNANARAALVAHYNYLRTWGIKPRVHFYAISMGAFAASLAIRDRSFPVASVYYAQPALNLTSAWSSGFAANVKDAWNNDTALRDANDPVLQAASVYSGVPAFFVAAPSSAPNPDTTVPKNVNTDTMLTLLGSTVSKWSTEVNGPHGSAEHFRPNEALSLFSGNP